MLRRGHLHGGEAGGAGEGADFHEGLHANTLVDLEQEDRGRARRRFWMLAQLDGQAVAVINAAIKDEHIIAFGGEDGQNRVGGQAGQGAAGNDGQGCRGREAQRHAGMKQVARTEHPQEQAQEQDVEPGHGFQPQIRPAQMAGQAQWAGEGHGGSGGGLGAIRNGLARLQPSYCYVVAHTKQ